MLRGSIQIVSDRGIVVAKKWPRKRPEKPTPAQAEVRRLFGQMAKATKAVTWFDRQGAIINAVGIPLLPRDIIELAMVGKWIQWDYLGDAEEIMPDVQLILGQLGLEPGSIILCTNEGYVLLPPPEEIAWLRFDPTLNAASWFTGNPTGIDELTGDVIAGPGSGPQAATLSATGVTAGVYTTPDITINSAGRITAAASNPATPGITELTGDATAGPGSGSQILTLSASGVTPGAYTAPNITINAAGRITLAANSGLVSGLNQLTGDVTAGPGTGSQAATLSNTGVVAATYTAPTLAINAAGRITSAANGSTLTSGGQAHPGIRTGAFYPPMLGAALTTPACPANRIYPRLFYFPASVTLQSVNLNILSITGTPSLEFGLYSNNHGLPDQLITDFGSLVLTSTGNKAITSIGQVIPAGFYHFVVAFSAQLTCTGQNATDMPAQFMLGMDQAIPGAQRSPVYGGWTFSAGALPSSFPAVTYNAGFNPTIVLGF